MPTLPAFALLAALGVTAHAQTSGDALAGQRLYIDTLAELGDPLGVVNRCSDCHNTTGNAALTGLDAVSERRLVLGQSAFAAVSQDNARAFINLALNSSISNGEMDQFKNGVLSPENIADLAAYIADVPKLVDGAGASVERVEFDAAAVNGTAIETLTLRHSVATAVPLTVGSISVSAGNDFSLTGGSCAALSAPLPGGGSCTVQITYTATGAARRNAELTVALTQAGKPFSRSQPLTGGVQGVTPPPGAAAPAQDDGGGAGFTWGWLAALAAAALMARRVTRRAAGPAARRLPSS